MKLTVLIISLSGIGGIIFLEALALRAGIDGIALNAAIGAIAGIIGGLAGWLIPAPLKKKGREEDEKLAYRDEIH